MASSKLLVQSIALDMAPDLTIEKSKVIIKILLETTLLYSIDLSKSSKLK